ncbi:hypothetical protein PA25_36820 [Pseudoalteromonas sp. A25]|uniref:antiviral RADAR system adenosine triphosphatase RdrA n=1 Tax=Pseudoalteromonas sp. A25 TaxID=116092 RepID=UPI0012608FD8|nr:antiviral RADAR system adenosine triphosphatase RdrA [Pseudoalteromonas sp. A25]BBN83697.1 hypothetical protein PA25_36820 [Pseudoalteromonas sp. A25]
MSQTHILNLDKNEFRDDFIGKDNLNELWQDEAREGLISRLQTCLAEAKHYAKSRADNPHKTWLSHNAILVSGQRGTGKTVFLRNSEAIWKNASQQSDNNKSALYFLDVIDPTMLVNDDSFANVIVAQIYSEIEKHMLHLAHVSGSSSKQADKNKFTQALKKLADSLGKSSEFNGHTGIDKVQHYKSGIHIESYFHEFVEISIKILGCNALVLPIDDVDMALDRAFEVVDDVRRLLGCPYIIPIVSGDMRLYEHMTQVHFDDKAYKKHRHNPALINEGKAVTKELTTAYLTKVFPNQMRLSLLPISRLVNSLEITQKVGNKSLGYPIKEYDKLLFQAFYPLCHNNEVLQNWPEPESSRELVQLARAIPPSHIDTSLSEKNVPQPDSKTLWESYASWAEQKKNGVAYTNAASYLTLVNRNTEQPFDIQKLLSFNPKMQMDKELYPWARVAFYKQQTAEMAKIESEKDRTNNRDILDSVFNAQSLTLRSMPPLEFFDFKLFISNKTIDNTPKTFLQDDQTGLSSSVRDRVSTEQLLLDIFTHKDFYSTMSNTYRFVFMSRAFEIIAYSFLSPTADHKQLADNIMAILSRAPFYSIFNMNMTKAVFNDDDDAETEELEHNNSTQASTAAELSNRIANWHINNKTLFEQIDTRKLTELLAYMFNKTFTAFNLFKYQRLLKTEERRSLFKKNQGYKDEHLSDLVTRFNYMLLNSAYSAGVQGEAIAANVAMTDNYTTIRDNSEFERFDRTLMRNRAFLEEQSKSSDLTAGDTPSLTLAFCQALEQHPIIKLNHLDKGKTLMLGKYKETAVAINDAIFGQLPQSAPTVVLSEEIDDKIYTTLVELLALYHMDEQTRASTARLRNWLTQNTDNIIKRSSAFKWLFQYPKEILQQFKENRGLNAQSDEGKVLSALIVSGLFK